MTWSSEQFDNFIKKRKNLCPQQYDKMLEGLLLMSCLCWSLFPNKNVSVEKGIINSKGTSTLANFAPLSQANKKSVITSILNEEGVPKAEAKLPNQRV
jgi:hypothetical protein